MVSPRLAACIAIRGKRSGLSIVPISEAKPPLFRHELEVNHKLEKYHCSFDWVHRYTQHESVGVLLRNIKGGHQRWVSTDIVSHMKKIGCLWYC